MTLPQKGDLVWGNDIRSSRMHIDAFLIEDDKVLVSIL